MWRWQALSTTPHAPTLPPLLFPPIREYHFLKLVGPEVALVGIDMRSKRTKEQIIPPVTLRGVGSIMEQFVFVCAQGGGVCFVMVRSADQGTDPAPGDSPRDEMEWRV